MNRHEAHLDPRFESTQDGSRWRAWQGGIARGVWNALRETNMLLGMWDEASQTLTIRRTNGQTYKVKASAITAGSHKVFGVETVGNEVHVLTAHNSNQRPNRRVVFNDSGTYKGSRGI